MKTGFHWQGALVAAVLALAGALFQKAGARLRYGLSCGWLALQRLKTWNVAPVDSLWEQRTQRLSQALRVSRPVRAAKSALARVPAVIGWFRPLILVPAGAFTGVDPRQLEALLAHELAHIRFRGLLSREPYGIHSWLGCPTRPPRSARPLCACAPS